MAAAARAVTGLTHSPVRAGRALRALALSALLSSICAYGDEAMFMTTVPADFSQPAAENDDDGRLLAAVDDTGWYNVHIDEEGGLPGFAFTVGHFHKRAHPEIMVIGLSAAVADKLLNIAAIKIVGAGATIEPYKKYTDLTEGLSVTFIPVALEYYGDYLGYANWYYGAMPRPYPALQMVWPDREGKYPWDKGYDTRYARLQPILGPTP